jgi:hypothetical protein
MAAIARAYNIPAGSETIITMTIPAATDPPLIKEAKSRLIISDFAGD